MRSKLSAIGRTALVGAVIVVVMAAAAGFLVSSTRTVTSTPTTIQTTTATEGAPTVTATFTLNTSSTNATNASFSSSEISNSTICMVAVEGNGVYLHIVSDSSNDSLSGIKVLAAPKANSCPGSFIPYPFEQTSNASGWVSLNFPNLQANEGRDLLGLWKGCEGTI